MAFENHAAYFDTALGVSSTALPLDIPVGTMPVRAILQPVAGAVHFRYTGNNPTTGTGGGHYLATNEEAILEGVENIRNVRVIRSGSTDATLYYTLERG